MLFEPINSHFDRWCRGTIIVVLMIVPNFSVVADETETTLEKIRQALGIESTVDDAAWTLAGNCKVGGCDGEFKLEFDRSGKFRCGVQGPLPESVGYDGDLCWRTSWLGTPRIVELGEREEELVTWSIITGDVFKSNAPFQIELDETRKNESDRATLLVTTAAGRNQHRVVVSRESWLPIELHLDGKDHVLTFADYDEANGCFFPRSLDLGKNRQFSVTTIERADSIDDKRFAFQKELPNNSSVDSSQSPLLETKRARTGHILVKTEIHGAETACWFVLDTGAEGLIINRSYADQLKLDAFGEIDVQRAGGTRKARFRRASSLSVGPLSIAEPIFIEAGLDHWERPLGEKVAGILGYEMLARSVVEFDYPNKTISVFDSATYQPGDVHWHELFLSARHPAIKATFEDKHDGVFKIDTGAAGATVIFHTPTVEKLGLLDGRKTRTIRTAGVGGTVELELGTLSKFEFAGHEFMDQSVGFATSELGAFGDVHTTGVIGGQLIHRLKMIVDYPRKRLAFVESPTPEGDK